MKSHRLIVILFIGILSTGNLSFSQENDSTNTAFRKGRWFTGLSGSISSTNTEVKSANFESTTNNYGINIETGKFVKDRWLIGGLFQANKNSTGGNFDRTAETFYIGPYSNYYFTDNKSGSLFARGSLGYVRYKDKTAVQQLGSLFEESSEGDGFGALLGVGYSYTINDFIAFDLGVNVNLFWVDIEQQTIPNGAIINTSFSSNDISLSFGFNIILDDFFF